MLDLRRAAAIIFALVGVLPLLLFVFFLWHFDLAARTEAQMGLFLALVVAVLGYAVFHRMVARISSLARAVDVAAPVDATGDRKSTRLNSSHRTISYAVFCLKKKKNKHSTQLPITRVSCLVS